MSRTKPERSLTEKSQDSSDSDTDTMSSVSSTGSFRDDEVYDEVDEEQKARQRTAQCIRNTANFSRVKSFHLMEKGDFDKDMLNLYVKEAAPKIEALLEKIQRLDEKDWKDHGKLFKHMIFTDVQSSTYGAKILASAMYARGFQPAFHIHGRGFGLYDDEKLMETKGKNFGVLMSKTFYDRSMNMKFRKRQLDLFNRRPENTQGDLMRFIILDQGFKEGIDLFDLKYVHLFEPLVVKADEKQAIGRGTRFCGQKGLVFHPRYGWPLYVFRYEVKIPKELQGRFQDSKQMFDLYLKYSDLDLRKVVFASELERVAIHSAVDGELTSPIHQFTIEVPPPVLGSHTKKEGGAVSTRYSREYAVPPSKKMGLDAMKKFIFKHYMGFRYPHVKLENQCLGVSSGGSGNIVEFTPTQDFVRHFFQPSSAYKGMLLWHSVGTGKCHAKDTPILMYDGTVRMVQDVRVGDLLMGDDSTPRRVLSLAQGEDEMYQIGSPSDSYTVNSEHILCLQEQDGGEVTEIEVKDFLQLSADQQKKLHGFRVGVQFLEREVPEDPYLFGSKLGEGTGYEIPLTYLANSRENRLQLLAGFVDAFGGRLVVSHPSAKVIEDLVYLVRSLGLRADTVEDGLAISGKVSIIPTRFPLPKEEEDSLLYPIEVKPVGHGKYYGFTLDGNNRYLLGDFTVTHNTCSAIATATTSFEKEGYTILWVTRHTLKSDIWKNMYQQVCSLSIQEKIRDGLKLPDKITSPKKYLPKTWMDPISYKQFSNMLLQKNKIYGNIIQRNGSEDPLHKTLLIIDEAHKLYSPGVASSEKPNTDILETMIENSYKMSGKDSVRVLLMTATPYTEDGMEMVKLMNLLREGEDKFPTTFEKFGEDYLDEQGYFRKSGEKKLQNALSGYISYLNRSQDARNFAHPVLENVVVDLSIPKDKEKEKREDIYMVRIKELKEKLRDEKKRYKNIYKEATKENKEHKKEAVADCKEEVKRDMEIQAEQSKQQKEVGLERCKALPVKERKACKERVTDAFRIRQQGAKEEKSRRMENCKEVEPAQQNNRATERNHRVLQESIKQKEEALEKLQTIVAERKENRSKQMEEIKGLQAELKEKKVPLRQLQKEVIRERKKIRKIKDKVEKKKAQEKLRKEKVVRLVEMKKDILQIRNEKVKLQVERKREAVKEGRASLPDISQATALEKRCKV